ncbi:MAG TPA: hypothetical protein VK541_05080 [Pedobacter sp.]|uniref:hypothetical protein n=1 Tax=Pedobacter sp. TaxID=1411316 RepID=UPI002BACA964|nr:hypothetical protein [Pedobacter sp.]HMI01833.1 hypothetical protein [Pedobacter sp.]
MTEIEIYKQNALAEIPATELEVFQALSSRMIKDVPAAVLFDVFRAAVVKCYALTRFECPRGEEFTLIVDQTMQTAKKKYGTLREAEVIIAFTRGTLKEYGEYMGLSIVSFIGFIKGYVNEVSRIKLLAERNKSPEQINAPTLAEQKENFITRLEELFEMHKIGKQILPTEAKFYFEKLYSAGVIRLTQEARLKLKEEAFERLVPLKNPYNAKDGQEHKKLQETYLVFLEMGTDGDEVRKEAMYLGLMQWFKNLYDFERTIRDEIV